MASSRTDGLSGAGDVFRPGIVVGFHFSLSGLIPRCLQRKFAYSRLDTPQLLRGGFIPRIILMYPSDLSDAEWQLIAPFFNLSFFYLF